MRKTVVLLFILCTCRLSAQTAAVTTLLSVNEGLSQGMVFDVLESRDGFIWIATKDGLNRYDGYGFEIFSPDPFDPFSIAASEIYQVFEDLRGWLWLGYEGGLDVFMPDAGRFFHLSIPLSDGFDGYFESLAETQEGTIWIANKGNLWKVEDAGTVLLKAASSDRAFPDIKVAKMEAPTGGQSANGLQFNSVFLAKDQTLLAGTTNGLYRVDTHTGKLYPQPEALPGVNLNIIGEDKSGWLWMQSYEGLWVQKKPGGPTQKVNISIGKYCRFDPEGNLWSLTGNILRKWEPSMLAAAQDPMLKLDLASFSLEEAFYLTDLAIDRSGNVWVGTSGYGLLKVVSAKPKFLSYLPYTSHRMFAEDPGGRLFSVAYSQKLYVGKQFGQSQPNPWMINFPSNVLVGATCFDHQGNCWVIGGENVLYRIDGRTKETKSYEGGGIGLLYNQQGKLLTLTEEALLEFDPATEKFTSHTYEKRLPFNYNSKIFHNYFFEDSESVLWIYAYQGLLKATPTTGGYRFEQFLNNPQDRSSLSTNIVFSVAEDPLEPRRYRWVGTKGGGLNRLDLQTGKFTHYQTEQGLPDNVVYGILTSLASLPPAPSKGGEGVTSPPPLEGAGGRLGHLWLSTNKGLCRFRVEEKTVKNFTAADGLQSNEFNQASFFKTKDGTMIFGGVNGVTVFHPDSLRFNERRPRTVITRLWVNSRPADLIRAKDEAFEIVKTDGQISRLNLVHHQNLVSLEFAALEFSNPSQNQYRYQLLRHRFFKNNEDENWVELGAKNSVQFADLQPGSYTFKVLGSNNDGIWSEMPATFEIVIRPPWWATWWAYLLYASVIVLGIFLYNRHLLRQKLEQQETLRLRELDEFKNRFFTNITHEFRTPLTVILGMTSLPPAPSKGGGGVTSPPPLEGAGGRLALIRRNAESLLRLINQILDLAKMEANALKINYIQGDILPYLRYITESLHSLANAQNVMLRVETKEAEIVMDFDPERLLQIVYNLLSNAIKFTPSGGRVVLKAGMRDEGRGMNWQAASSLVPHPSSLILTVSDTGIGIPPEDLPLIFDRFYQVGTPPSGARGAAGGTGIGLAFTKELIKALGGEISVESHTSPSEPVPTRREDRGVGTTFTVRLPITNNALLSAGATFEAAPGSVVPVQQQEGRPQASPLRSSDVGVQTNVLIVEDNPDVVEYLAACVGEKYQLDFAYNGRAGIEKALEIVPDLIISDVMMPEKDGFEVVETLKNDERTSHIPIILLTAKADVESRIMGLRRGADAYLSKPFHQEELLVTLANLLEMRRKLQAKYRISGDAAAPLIPHPSILIPDPEDAFLQKLRSAIEGQLGNAELTAEDVCRTIGMGRTNLYAKLSALTGMSFNLYLRSMRLHRAMKLLQTTDMNVSEVAFEVGFNDPKYFSRMFSEEFGKPPSEVRGK